MSVSCWRKRLRDRVRGRKLVYNINDEVVKVVRKQEML